MTKDIIEDKTPSDALRAAGMYVLMDDISAETVKPVVEWIM
jgi:hypothetical protein